MNNTMLHCMTSNTMYNASFELDNLWKGMTLWAMMERVHGTKKVWNHCFKYWEIQ